MLTSSEFSEFIKIYCDECKPLWLLWNIASRNAGKCITLNKLMTIGSTVTLNRCRDELGLVGLDYVAGLNHKVGRIQEISYSYLEGALLRLKVDFNGCLFDVWSAGCIPMNHSVSLDIETVEVWNRIWGKRDSEERAGSINWYPLLYRV